MSSAVLLKSHENIADFEKERSSAAFPNRGEYTIDFINAVEACVGRSRANQLNHLELVFGSHWKQELEGIGNNNDIDFGRAITARIDSARNAISDYRELFGDSAYNTNGLQGARKTSVEKYIEENELPILKELDKLEEQLIEAKKILKDPKTRAQYLAAHLELPVTEESTEFFRWPTSHFDSRVPLYGSETLKGIENWNGIAGDYIVDICPEIIQTIAMAKEANALANFQCGAFDNITLFDGTVVPAETVRDAIIKACEEVAKGELNSEFPLEIRQGGAYTSLNMNANEVIANRANQWIYYLMEREDRYAIGLFQPLHPNDHINAPNSTNDVIPTALKGAVLLKNEGVVDVMARITSIFMALGVTHIDSIKQARTHLQDAVATSSGIDFHSWGSELLSCIELVKDGAARMHRSNSLGAGAVGTPLNTHPEYIKEIGKELKEVYAKYGMPFVPEQVHDLAQSTWAWGIINSYAQQHRTLADSLDKIMNDLRLMASGPHAGFGEISLPARQKGSSIMPGKVNPVIPELMNQICMEVRAYSDIVSQVSRGGQCQLNVFESAGLYALSKSCNILTVSSEKLIELCLEGLEVNKEIGEKHFWAAGGFITGLVPILGYDKTTDMYKAMQVNQTNPKVFFTDPDILESYNVSPEEAFKIKEIIDNPLILVHGKKKEA